MTLDEAIKHCKEVAKKCDSCGAEHKQLVEWLNFGIGGLKMAENKMEAVAQLFGKRLGERFTVNFYNRLFDVAFDKSGLRVFSDEIFEDELSRLLLEGLIIGNAVIVND